MNKFAWLISIAVFWLPAGMRGQSGTNVVIAFSTTNSTPLNPGFAGFATEMFNTGLQYDNTNFQRIAATLSPGWLRYPGGISDDAFCWTNGLILTNWVNVISSNGETSAANSCQTAYLPALGKGGLQFTNFARLAQNVGGAKIIVCLNCFTDTTNSAGAFAAFAASNHIPVAAWELCNEPYNFTATNGNDFFTNGTDYANKMLPYRNAIKAADSNAVVAVFYSNPGNGGTVWDNALNKYANKYWDTVSYHYYPQPTYTNFPDMMAYDNGLLLSNTASYVTNVLMVSNGPSTTCMITEFQPVQGSGAGTTNQNPNEPSMTLYGGIYAAEFVLRMSVVPQMRYVGNFQLFNDNGISATNVFRPAAVNAANAGYITNTQNLPFGFYLSAQVAAQAVAYWAVNRSVANYATSISANGPTVPTSANYDTNMPALYAQAYEGGNGKRYVVLTNKGATNATVQIVQDGVALTNQFLEAFVTGADPSATNTAPQASPVQLQTNTAANPVTIPEYSVVRLEWTVFNVPPPALALTAGNATEVVSWAGLTNVLYSVQSATDLFASWPTLGRVAGSRTNFSFTNWSTSPRQFYRLQVP